ncbi:MAG: hypothetical protein ACEQSK_08355 [Sphingomonadaceae bacterium]
MMLHRANESKFLLMIINITRMNKVSNGPSFTRQSASAARIGVSRPRAVLTIEELFMATVLRHRKVKIVVLDVGELIDGHCGPGDIAILADASGWWTKFVGEDGQVDCYGDPYPSYNEALWAAKAAAEFGLE